MTKLGEVFVWAQEISVTAMEEASRWSHPQIEVDHLFLALVLNRGQAGGVLRGLGVDLKSARAALEQIHAERIDSLGLKVDALSPSPIVDPLQRGLAWSPRAFAVLKQAPASDDLEFLVALIDEPSGLVAEVLAKLDLDPTTVHAAIEQCRSRQELALPTKPRREVSHSSFIPASIEHVWALVADPLRRCEWDDTIARAEPVGPGRWNLYAAERRPDGKARRVAVGYKWSQIREIDCVPQSQIRWEVSLPGLGEDAEKHFFSVDVARVTGGTDLRLTWRFASPPRFSGSVRRLLAPVSTAATRYQLIAATAKVSRAFRST